MSSKSSFSNSTSQSYAQALYELAKENSELQKTEDGINNLHKLFDNSLDFKEMILSPTISKEYKKTVCCRSFDMLDKNGSFVIIDWFINNWKNNSFSN